MAIYTVRVQSRCAAKDPHITFEVYRDGVHRRSLSMLMSEVSQSDIDTLEELFPALIRLAVKGAGASTYAQAKAAIESAQWVW